MNERYGQHETARDGFNAGYRPDRHAHAPESAPARFPRGKDGPTREPQTGGSPGDPQHAEHQHGHVGYAAIGSDLLPADGHCPGRNVQVGFTYSF
jgi:hypothetical protein